MNMFRVLVSSVTWRVLGGRSAVGLVDRVLVRVHGADGRERFLVPRLLR